LSLPSDEADFFFLDFFSLSSFLLFLTSFSKSSSELMSIFSVSNLSDFLDFFETTSSSDFSSLSDSSSDFLSFLGFSSTFSAFLFFLDFSFNFLSTSSSPDSSFESTRSMGSSRSIGLSDFLVSSSDFFFEFLSSSSSEFRNPRKFIQFFYFKLQQNGFKRTLMQSFIFRKFTCRF
jgi:hypothetical protein